MGQKRHRLQAAPRTYLLFACFFVAMIFLSVFSSFPAHAEQSKDATAPVLTPNITGGDLRNVVTLTLRIDDDHRQYSSIEIVDKEGEPLTPRREVSDTTGAETISLAWDTHQPGEGQYVIIYSATDASNHTTQEKRNVTVNNDKPFVLLSESAASRTIGGFVSRKDVTMAVKIDGVSAGNTPAVVAEPENDGWYKWSVAAPELIAGKEHAVSVTAYSEGTKLWSDEAGRMLMFTPVVPPAQDPKTPVVVAPILTLVEEIGQFIAPDLSVAAEPRLYSTSASDLLVGDGDRQNVKSFESLAGKPTASQVLGDQTTNPVDVLPIQATSIGWMLFGYAWYWWLTMAALLGAAVVAGVRALRHRYTDVLASV